MDRHLMLRFSPFSLSRRDADVKGEEQRLSHILPISCLECPISRWLIGNMTTLWLWICQSYCEGIMNFPPISGVVILPQLGCLYDYP